MKVVSISRIRLLLFFIGMSILTFSIFALAIKIYYEFSTGLDGFLNTVYFFTIGTRSILISLIIATLIGIWIGLKKNYKNLKNGSTYSLIYAYF